MSRFGTRAAGSVALQRRRGEESCSSPGLLSWCAYAGSGSGEVMRERMAVVGDVELGQDGKPRQPRARFGDGRS